jgi:hypothetical protein
VTHGLGFDPPIFPSHRMKNRLAEVGPQAFDLMFVTF